MKKLIIQMLLRWYVGKNREINKLDEDIEYDCFLFKRPEDVEKLVKTLLTAQTLWHFESKSEVERNMVKGAAMMLKFLRDGHTLALELKESDSDEILRREWKKWRYRKYF